MGPPTANEALLPAHSQSEVHVLTHVQTDRQTDRQTNTQSVCGLIQCQASSILQNVRYARFIFDSHSSRQEPLKSSLTKIDTMNIIITMNIIRPSTH